MNFKDIQERFKRFNIEAGKNDRGYYTVAFYKNTNYTNSNTLKIFECVEDLKDDLYRLEQEGGFF